MRFYIIDNKQIPWGDYGNTLVYGFISKDDTGDIIIERVGPMIPNIYSYNTYIAVTDPYKKAIEDTNLKGIIFSPAKKKKIVNLDWTKWDVNKDIPDTPKSGEPEDFILNRKHNPETAQEMPDIWVMLLNTTATGVIDKLKAEKAKLDDFSYVSLDLATWDGSDIFRTRRLGYIFCTENAKKALEQYTEYLTFYEIEAN